MRILDIIEKKKLNQTLTKEEIQFWIDGIVDESIPTYQSSALLMAIVLNGMSDEETSYLTLSMLHSGDIIDLSGIDGIKVDKHSTGGVGDKTTLILSPIVAAAGAKVAKMSGRGLGHTGGTLDKLESIPGYRIDISNDEFIKQVNDINIAVVGQTGNLVYADKVLYGLRDVTATVDSIPLIASSIMSKKLAGGAQCILLDVKYGEGAFMKDVDSAKELASTMIAIGKNLGLVINAMISNMNQPLGMTIGNALEVKEAVETLQNKGPKALEELCIHAAGIMLFQAKLVESEAAGIRLANDVLQSGAAYKVFKEWISSQHGDISLLEDLDAFTKADYKVDVCATKGGYVNDLAAMELGLVSMHLGAGRATVEDVIDMKAGITLKVSVGDKVREGDVLCTLQSNSIITNAHIQDALDCFSIKDEKVDASPLIADVL